MREHLHRAIDKVFDRRLTVHDREDFDQLEPDMIGKLQLVGYDIGTDDIETVSLQMVVPLIHTFLREGEHSPTLMMQAAWADGFVIGVMYERELRQSD